MLDSYEVSKVCIVWFRKDLRLIANPALLAAQRAGYQILALYIEDTSLKYQSGAALNVFKHFALAKLAKELLAQGLELKLAKGDATLIISELAELTKAKAVYWNRLYEPDAISRDTEIKSSLQAKGLEIQSYNSSLIFEPWEITRDGSAFKVFTAYHRRHTELAVTRELEAQLAHLDCSVPKLLAAPKFEFGIKLEDLQLLPKLNWDSGIRSFWQLEAMQDPLQLASDFASQRARDYPDLRNRPDLDGVSKLSPYLALGMISAPMIYAALIKSGLNAGKREYIRQLAWRDFAYHLLYHMPQLVTEPQRLGFKHFPWQQNAEILQVWQQGRTGYPLVDAGMRQLWHTGWMHNRVRMIVASFLVKDLLIDWREGAKWFMQTLVDADLANNTMGWQWCAGCGVDAAPYFRIFNPATQAEKFDPDGAYIRRWLPDYGTADYPPPIVDHARARARALEIYKSLR